MNPENNNPEQDTQAASSPSVDSSPQESINPASDTSSVPQAQPTSQGMQPPQGTQPAEANQASQGASSGGINFNRPEVNASVPRFSSPNFGRPNPGQGPASQDQAQPVPNPPKKGNKIIIVIMTILIVLILAAVAYFAFAKDRDETQAGNQNSQPVASSDQVQEAELIETTYSTHEQQSEEPLRLAVEHPSDWKVEQDEDWDFDGFMAKGDMRIISQSGIVLEFRDGSYGGRGGTCEPDNFKYQLVKKIPTKISDVYFTSYRSEELAAVEDASWLESVFLENVNKAKEFNSDGRRDSHINLKEGEFNTGVCDNISPLGYNSYAEGSNDILISVVDAENQRIPFSEIEDDIDFIKMLESLRIAEE